jgi:hypothetical protein
MLYLFKHVIEKSFLTLNEIIRAFVKDIRDTNDPALGTVYNAKKVSSIYTDIFIQYVSAIQYPKSHFHLG